MPFSRPMPAVPEAAERHVRRDHPVGVDPHGAGPQLAPRPGARGARPCVHTAPASPYGVSLASLSASSSVRERQRGQRPGRRPPRGRPCRPASTPVNSVGLTNNPPRSAAASPPQATVAPSALAVLEVAEHLLVLRPVGDRAHLGLRLVRVAELDRVRARSATSRTSSSWTLSCTISREPAMQVWPVAANTPGDDAVGGRVEVGVREDDLRRLAAQLQRHPVEVLRGGLRDRPVRSPSTR